MTHTKEIASKDKVKMAKRLNHLLADTFLLYVKTLNFHWNIVDSRFASLHKFFEEQYEELAEAIDIMAERIRSLNHLAAGSMKEFLSLSTLKEDGNTLSGDEMLRHLLEDHEALARSCRPAIEEFQKMGDEGSADFLIERLRGHEKTAWMLRSHLTR